MKITITCSRCYNQMKIPDDKHIRFRCSDKTCRKNYEYKNGKRIKRKIVLPIVAITLFLFGLFDSIFFPTPIILGIAWFVWWLFKRSNNILKRFLSNLTLTTGIGFLFLFIIQLLVNIFLRPVNLEIPQWLITADNYTLSIRDNLKLWIDLSFLFFTLVLVTFFIITYFRPERKYVSKFLRFDSLVGRAFFVCLIITSFTFFSPKVLESITQDSFYKYYKIAYRENSKQERKQLLANELKKQLETEDYKNLLNHDSTFKVDFFEPNLTLNEVQKGSEEEIRDLMRYSNISKWHLPSSNWSEERLKESNLIEKTWNQKINYFYNNSGFSTKTAERSVTEQIINKSTKTKIISEEAVSLLSSVIARFIGEQNPEINQLIDQYISNVMEFAAGYFFDKSGIENILTNLFNGKFNSRKSILFSSLEQWKTKEKNKLNMLKQHEINKLAAIEEDKKNRRK